MSEQSLLNSCISAPGDVLDISGMQIRSLSGCQKFPHLKSLICNNCAISSLEQLSKLRSLPLLTHASFIGCAVTHDPLYRASVIRWLPQLQYLDGLRVSSGERKRAALSANVGPSSSRSSSPPASDSEAVADAAGDDESSRDEFSLPPTPSPVRLPPPAYASSPPYNRKNYSSIDHSRDNYGAAAAGKAVMPAPSPRLMHLPPPLHSRQISSSASRVSRSIWRKQSALFKISGDDRAS